MVFLFQTKQGGSQLNQRDLALQEVLRSISGMESRDLNRLFTAIKNEHMPSNQELQKKAIQAFVEKITGQTSDTPKISDSTKIFTDVLKLSPEDQRRLELPKKPTLNDFKDAMSELEFKHAQQVMNPAG